ncbi:hypothetical protein ACHQM5_001941 [Ranunculus cassubicifolius]
MFFIGRLPEISPDTLLSFQNTTFRFSPSSDEELCDVSCNRAGKILMGMRNAYKLMLGFDYLTLLHRFQHLCGRDLTPLVNMSRLELHMYPANSQFEVITFLLGICPNLQSLEIILREHKPPENVLDQEEDMQSQVLSTEGILKHLKTFEFRDFGGTGSELKLVKYVLENATIMEKVDIVFSLEMEKDLKTQVSIREMIVAYPKISSNAIISFSSDQ